MKKIRRGNDFLFAWEIERNGLPEDLSSVLEKHLHLSVFGKRVELIEGIDYDIIGNVIRIEVTPAIANILGAYKAEFHYILPDTGLIDEDRKCAVDVDAFIIVNSTAQADEPSEFTVTSDMAIAFKGDKGDKGDSFTYADFTPEQIAELQQPATDAISSIQEVELAVETAEGLRAEAETARNTAEGERQTNTATAILQANAARDLANKKAGLAATATTEANTAAMAANTAAGLADTARLSIQDDLALKANQTDLAQLESGVKDTTEKAGASSLAELNARLLALEKIVSSTLRSTIEVTREFNVWGKTNLILIGSGAATSAPDFIGQKYIDTTGGNVYVAVGVATAGNWKLV